MQVFLLTGCSSITYYPNEKPKNLEVRKTIKMESFLDGAQIWIKIYELEGKCKTKYQGQLWIKENKTLIGLPINKASYLIVKFYSGGKLTGYNSSVSESAVINIRPGYKYRADVKYVDSSYYLGLSERSINSRKWKPLPVQGLVGCR